jgi:hypothetical protein
MAATPDAPCPAEKSQLLVRWPAWAKDHQMWRSIWFFADVARVADGTSHALSLLRASEEAGLADRLLNLGTLTTPVHLLRYNKDNESWWTNLRTVSVGSRLNTRFCMHTSESLTPGKHSDGVLHSRAGIH